MSSPDWSEPVIRPYNGIFPKIHPEAYVAGGVLVIGDVEIGRESSVWFGSIVRGDVHYIRIGERTNIQDGCILHVTRGKWPLTMGDDITVGHRVTLHGCTVRSRCLIGMGAIVLDGSEVGEGAIVGAGSVVAPGTVIPARTLAMGVPARVKRQVTEKEWEESVRLAQRYVEHAREYARDSGKGAG
jgi:gamma-carbonic anhydrase